MFPIFSDITDKHFIIIGVLFRLPIIFDLIWELIPVFFVFVAIFIAYYGGDDGDHRQVRCKMLAHKLKYYDTGIDMRYLPTYMSIILPLWTLYILYFIIESVIKDNLIDFIVLLITFITQVLAIILIRGIDKIGFVINLIAIINIGIAYAYISGPVSLLWIINLAIAVGYVAYHINYFFVRRDLFINSIRELKRQAED